MNEEENKRIVRRFVEEMWNQRKLDLAHEIIAPDCVTHQLRGGAEAAGTPRTSELVKREAEAWLAGFPDLHFDLEQMIAQGDQVVSRYTLRGTHIGNWNGVPASNKRISVPMMTIH